VRDQAGKLRVPSGQSLSLTGQGTMDYLIQGVIGTSGGAS
jgi:hypothetical protein